MTNDAQVFSENAVTIVALTWRTTDGVILITVGITMLIPKSRKMNKAAFGRSFIMVVYYSSFLPKQIILMKW